MSLTELKLRVGTGEHTRTLRVEIVEYGAEGTLYLVAVVGADHMAPPEQESTALAVLTLGQLDELVDGLQKFVASEVRKR